MTVLGRVLLAMALWVVLCTWQSSEDRVRQFATESAQTLVLRVTALAMTGDKERFIAAGADGYVSRPVSQTGLKKEMDARLARFKAQGHP